MIASSSGSERRGEDAFVRAAAAIDAALDSVISDPASRTTGGPLGTKAFGERVTAQLTSA
jgi:hypothetical protein